MEKRFAYRASREVGVDLRFEPTDAAWSDLTSPGKQIPAFESPNGAGGEARSFDDFSEAENAKAVRGFGKKRGCFFVHRSDSPGSVETALESRAALRAGRLPSELLW
jgi:hypothetical protein